MVRYVRCMHLRRAVTAQRAIEVIEERISATQQPLNAAADNADLKRHVKLDEDGAAAGKPVNQAATLVAQSFGFEFSFLGPVVIVGVDKDTAEPAALSPAQAGAIFEVIRAPSA